jgi:hypothetical protein
MAAAKKRREKARAWMGKQHRIAQNLRTDRQNGLAIRGLHRSEVFKKMLATVLRLT